MNNTLCDLSHDTRFPGPGSPGIARGGEMSMVRSSLANAREWSVMWRTWPLESGSGFESWHYYLPLFFFFFSVPSLVKHD